MVFPPIFKRQGNRTRQLQTSFICTELLLMQCFILNNFPLYTFAFKYVYTILYASLDLAYLLFKLAL